MIHEHTDRLRHPSDSSSRSADLVTDQPAGTTSPRWPAWARVLGVTVLFFVAMFASALLLMPVAELFPKTASGEAVVKILGHVFFGVLLVAAMAVFVRRVEGRPLSFSGFVLTRWSLPLLLLGAVAAGVVQLLAVVPAEALGEVAETEPFGAGAPVLLVTIMAITQALFLQGLPEELVYRGYMISTLRARPLVAVVVSTLVFTLLHLLSGGGQEGAVEMVLYLATPFGFSLSAAGLALLCGSVWPAVGVHAGFHWAWMIGSQMGLGDGPGMWVACGIGHTIIGIVALTVWYRRGARIDYHR